MKTSNFKCSFVNLTSKPKPEFELALLIETEIDIFTDKLVVRL